MSISGTGIIVGLIDENGVLPGNNLSDYNKNNDFKTIIPFLLDLVPQLGDPSVNSSSEYLPFIYAFFEWLETVGNPLDILYSFYRIIDPAYAANNSKYSSLFMAETAPLYPLQLAASFKVFLHEITDQYRRKGTQPSFDFFFRTIFNTAVTITYPTNRRYFSAPAIDTLDTIIRFVPPITVTDPTIYNNQFIMGTVSQSTLQIVSCVSLILDGTVYFQAVVTNVVGSFTTGEPFVNVSGENALSGTFTGVVISVSIPTAGTGYEVGTAIPFNAGPPGTITATAFIDSVLGGVSAITLENFGQGYINAPAVVIIGDGSGATAHAILNTSGNISSVVVDTPGTNYTYAYVSFVLPPINVNSLETAVTGGTTGQIRLAFQSPLPQVGDIIYFEGTIDALTVQSLVYNPTLGWFVNFTSVIPNSHSMGDLVTWQADPAPRVAASALAIISGGITSIQINDPGAGWTSPPTIDTSAITPGTGAVLTANIGTVGTFLDTTTQRFNGDFTVVPAQNYNILFGMSAALIGINFSSFSTANTFFEVGETVTDATGNKIGTVVQWVIQNQTLFIQPLSGLLEQFESGDVITGSVSGVTGTISNTNSSLVFRSGHDVVQIDTYGNLLFSATVISWDAYKNILITSSGSITNFDVNLPIIQGTFMSGLFVPDVAPEATAWMFGGSYSQPLLIDAGDGQVNNEYTYFVNSSLSTGTYDALLRANIHPAGLQYTGIVTSPTAGGGTTSASTVLVGVFMAFDPPTIPTVRIDYENPDYPTSTFFREMQIITLEEIGEPLIETYESTIIDSLFWYALPLVKYALKPVGLVMVTPSDPANVTIV